MTVLGERARWWVMIPGGYLTALLVAGFVVAAGWEISTTWPWAGAAAGLLAAVVVGWLRHG